MESGSYYMKQIDFHQTSAFMATSAGSAPALNIIESDGLLL
jgi:hypothetical protein